MIIRNHVTKTVKPSPLNSRGACTSLGQVGMRDCTLKVCLTAYPRLLSGDASSVLTLPVMNHPFGVAELLKTHTI